MWRAPENDYLGFQIGFKNFLFGVMGLSGARKGICELHWTHGICGCGVIGLV